MRLKIVIFYVLLATSWFVITTIPVLLSVLLPKVPRSIQSSERFAAREEQLSAGGEGRDSGVAGEA